MAAATRRGKGSLVAAPMYSQIPPRCPVLGRRAAKYYMCITWLSRDGTWLRQSANFAATFKTYPSEDPLNILNNTTQTDWQSEEAYPNSHIEIAGECIRSYILPHHHQYNVFVVVCTQAHTSTYAASPYHTYYVCHIIFSLFFGNEMS